MLTLFMNCSRILNHYIMYSEAHTSFNFKKIHVLIHLVANYYIFCIVFSRN